MNGASLRGADRVAATLPDALERALNSDLPACVNVPIERVAAPMVAP